MTTPITNAEFATQFVDEIVAYLATPNEATFITNLTATVNEWVVGAITPTQLAIQLSNALGNWNNFTTGQLQYYTVPVGGGTYSNGTVDMTDYLGNVTNIPGLALTVATLAAATGPRNRLINGSMQVDQRNCGNSNTAITYTVDRWYYGAIATGKITWGQNLGAVTPPVGLSAYLGAASTSAYSLSSSDYFEFYQAIEGLNAIDLCFGTSHAKAVTISFQVYSSLTGTFGGSLSNGGATRSYPFSFTIPTANTWTPISITIPGDTAGTWLTNNTQWGSLRFSLGVGSTYQGTAGAWASGNIVAPAGSVAVVSTNGATFYVTGVQLEAGTAASVFERRPYPVELPLCQRYYWKTYNQNVYPGQASQFSGSRRMRSYSGTYACADVPFPVVMRAAPSVTIYNPSTGAVGTIWDPDSSTSTSADVSVTSDSAVTVESSTVTVNNSNMFHIFAAAEL